MDILFILVILNYSTGSGKMAYNRRVRYIFSRQLVTIEEEL
jgi:hypothetical protein